MKVWLYEETHTSARHIFATYAAAEVYSRPYGMAKQRRH